MKCNLLDVVGTAGNEWPAHMFSEALRKVPIWSRTLRTVLIKKKGEVGAIRRIIWSKFRLASGHDVFMFVFVSAYIEFIASYSWTWSVLSQSDWDALFTPVLRLLSIVLNFMLDDKCDGFSLTFSGSSGTSGCWVRGSNCSLAMF